MSYTEKIEALIAERDELREALTAVADALDYLHGMTPQQTSALRKDAELLAWVLEHPETAAEELADAAAGDGTARGNLERRIGRIGDA